MSDFIKVVVAGSNEIMLVNLDRVLTIENAGKNVVQFFFDNGRSDLIANIPFEKMMNLFENRIKYT